jgi:hypothetical protein
MTCLPLSSSFFSKKDSDAVDWQWSRWGQNNARGGEKRKKWWWW